MTKLYLCQRTFSALLNNDMPRMNGEQLYTEVRALSKDLAKKIVFMSGKMTDFMKSTGNSFLAKPFSKKQLIETVKKLIS